MSKTNEPKLTDEQIKAMNLETEYLKDGDIYCSECHTKKTTDFRVGDWFASKRRCLCECEKKESQEKMIEEQKRTLVKKIEDLKSKSHLGVKYQGCSFENTDTSDAEFKAVYDRCKKYCEVAGEVLNDGDGIYLFGTKGAGKTHITACMANDLMERLYSVLYTNFSDISTNIRGTFGMKGSAEHDYLHKLENVDFLFIDDFGTELVKRNDQDLWLQEKVFEIINKRYNNKKPIIFTSNYSLIQVMKERGVASKTIDRINEICVSMELRGNSYRLKAKAQRVPKF